ncbi:hypothetical protein [Streptomyces cremeus]|uniref:Lipoprotein n=1 Tax=Streptomyces cremeus TaxID=66881 RepID=A0ABV5PEK9_STRCM
MRRSARLISISGISALAVLGTACSAGTDSTAPASGGRAGQTSSAGTPSPAPTADPAAAVRAAVEAAGKTTARIDEAIRLVGSGQDFTITVKGAFDMKADKGTLKTALAQTGAQAGKAVPLDEIFNGDTVYVRMPNERTGDTAWRSTSRGEAEAHYLMRSPLNDPEHVLRRAAMAHHVTEVGPEKVNGVATTHYRGGLNADAVLLGMARERRALMEGPLKEAGDGLPAFADVWVTEDGRIARIGLSCDLGAAKVETTMNLTAHGRTVKLPPLPRRAQPAAPGSIGGPLGG